jgi:DNA mismatch endonuclease (patch repair protein)
MADIVDKPTRSRMMSGIRSKNTKPEIAIRKALHAAGFRFRIHKSDLPGNPDIVLSKYKAVIFVHGCFWHGHNCHLFRMPSSNVEFWERKIERNRAVDARSTDELQRIGWRILTIWECSLKGKHRLPFDSVVQSVVNWLNDSPRSAEIMGG